MYLRITALLLILNITAIATRPVAIAVIGVKPSVPNALEIISNEIMAAFSNSDEYEPYERSKEALAALGGEHNFTQNSGLVLESEIRKMGKMLGVDYMCLIQSLKFGKEYSLNARLVHIESGKVESAANVASTFSNLPELYKNSGELSCKLLKTCEGVNSKAANTFVDSRGGKKYKMVKIGNQTWMAENLDYAASGSKCYNNDPANCNKYGRLYDWNTAKSACPSGWHLPSKAEWEALLEAVGGEATAGTKLKAKSGWDTRKDYYIPGTDNYGFSALPGGNYGFTIDAILSGKNNERKFDGIGNWGCWWSTNDNRSIVDIANYVGIRYNGEEASSSTEIKSNLLSVRCIQD